MRVGAMWIHTRFFLVTATGSNRFVTILCEVASDG